MREIRKTIITSEDVVFNSVGKDLCEKFFRGYTRKQWGLDLSELNAGVAARIPTRINNDDRYFTDIYQLMPLQGYTAMFQRMLDHPNITIKLDVEYNLIRDKTNPQMTVYTGPIDEFYRFQFGKLQYRSLRFKHKHLKNVNQYQSVGTVNYPNDFEYTRITEFKHLTGQKIKGTSILSEYSKSEGDPYYPIPSHENNKLFKKYWTLAQTETKVFFIGRLAQYKYYNMDQVVIEALTQVEFLNVCN